MAAQVVFVVDATHGTSDERWELTRKAAVLLCKSACERARPSSLPSEWWHQHTGEFAIVHAHSHPPSAHWVCLPSKFTSDASAFSKWLKPDGMAGDGLVDGAALLEAVLVAIHRVAWRANAKRHIVLLSHSAPRPLVKGVAEAAAANMGLPLPLASCWSPVPEALATARW